MEAAEHEDLPVLEKCLLLARVSSATYGTLAEAQRIITTHGGHSVWLFESGRTLGYGFTVGPLRYLVFRGTVPWDLRDWATDFRFLQKGHPGRHAGFLSAWQNVSDRVREWLRTGPPSRGLVLSGHSLGGAIATVAAFDLASEFAVSSVITFGCPRCGVRAFRKAYEARPANHLDVSGPSLASVTTRFVHAGDGVTILPPAGWYQHVGGAIQVASRRAFLPSERVDEESGALARISYLGPPPTPTPGTVDSRNMAWLLSELLHVGLMALGSSSAVLSPIWVPIARTLGFSLLDHPSERYVIALLYPAAEDAEAFARGDVIAARGALAPG